jgi:hypothetical protein
LEFGDQSDGSVLPSADTAAISFWALLGLACKGDVGPPLRLRHGLSVSPLVGLSHGAREVKPRGSFIWLTI